MLGLTDEGIVLVFKRKSKNFFFFLPFFGWYHQFLLMWMSWPFSCQQNDALSMLPQNIHVQFEKLGSRIGPIRDFPFLFSFLVNVSFSKSRKYQCISEHPGSMLKSEKFKEIWSVGSHANRSLCSHSNRSAIHLSHSPKDTSQAKLSHQKAQKQQVPEWQTNAINTRKVNSPRIYLIFFKLITILFFSFFV